MAIRSIRHQLTPAKAGLMLREGSVRGKPITKKQRGLFGAIRGGSKLRRKGY